MRKLIKQQLQEETGLLEQANSILKNPGEDVSSEQLLELLTQEQELAISIGSRIEETEGAGTQAVALLEEYCEVLWHLSQELTQEKDCGDSWQNRLGKLQELVDQIKVQIDELPRQYDVVFLPYKASMWDSLESVWMAADQDPDCTCYVIPIPYCDLNQDGSVGQVHYEASLMPSYVPVTHYEAYDIKKNRPDIIYIHNPYDNTNMVTRVAAEFYSEELKKHTDMLVYIPYYIGTQHLAEEHKLLSAYLHADKIILQNETMVEDVHSVIPREKLAALGSPKADRILRLEKEKNRVIGQMIPKAWKKKMKGKKVVLYNVSISGILQFSEQALDKIRYVLSKFENREDVVLLWRPHPLIESTLKSMRPALYEEYMQIKRKFIADDYGILDETPDVGVSVVAADAYVGEDSSSLVNYFGVLGKPVLFTDWKVTEELTREERKSLPTEGWFYREGDFYFLPRKQGLEHCLFRIGENAPNAELFARMPGSPNSKAECGNYCDIAYCNEWVILAAHQAEDIYLYNVSTREAIKLVLSKPCAGWRFDRIVQYQEKIFILPRNYPAIVECNLIKRGLIEHDLEDTGILLENVSKHGFLWAYVVKEHYLYLAEASRSRMLIFDLHSSTYSIRSIGDYDFGYFGMVFDGNYFWLSAWKDECIIRWEEGSGACIRYEYKIEDVHEQNNVQGTMGIIDNGDTLLLFYNVKQVILEMDKKTGRNSVVHAVYMNIKEGVKKRNSSEVGFVHVKQIDDRVGYLNDYDCSLNIFRKDTKEIKSYICCLSDKALYEYEEKLIEDSKLVKCTPYQLSERSIGITAFLDYVVNRKNGYYEEEQKKYNMLMNNTLGKSGQAIHEYVKSHDIA